MKQNPDDRRDNVDKLQNTIDNTIKNIHEAESMIDSTDNRNTQAELKSKNERREQALDSLIDEIKDEACHKKNSSK
ncbi:small acid-soluble spore protein Tlp [Clostridium perfringens]|nr:small acid-soluble spore protein Tlp [Clostridium perfringens]